MAESGTAQRRSVDYEDVGSDYHEKRQLQKGAAGWVLLAGLGVAYVISGDFAGWNFGLAEGGWGGLLIATILMGTMYTCMVFALAELSSTISTAGGGYGFGRRALGPLGGFLTGTAILIEYVMAPAAIVVFIGGYVESLDIFGITSGWPVYLAFYAAFVGIHLIGVGEALKVTFVITAIAVVALLVFVVVMIPEFSTRQPDQHRARPRQGGLLRLPAVRLAGHLGGVPVRDLVLPGGRGRPARRRGDARPEEGHAARPDRGHDDPARLRRADAPLHARRRRRGRDQGLRQPAPAGDRRGEGRGHVRRRLRQHGRPVRPDRELLLDHLRLLAPAVRAVARGLSAARPVGDLEPQGAHDRADRARDDRLPARGDHRGRGDDAQHRGLRRDGLLRADDARAHRAALARARPRTRLPDPGRHRHLGRRARAGAAGRGGDVPRRREGGVHHARRLRGGGGVLLLLLAASPRLLRAGGRVRGDHVRRVGAQG